MLASTTGGLRRACSNAISRNTIVDSINSKTHTKVRYPVHNLTLDFLPRHCNTNSSSHIVFVSGCDRARPPRTRAFYSRPWAVSLCFPPGVPLGASPRLTLL
jgi:hypothetical protein